MHRALRAGLLTIAALAAAASPSFAQSAAVIAPAFEQAQATPPAWGTTAESILTIAGSDVNAPTSNTTFTTTTANGVGVYPTDSSTALWWAGVRLPSGALVTRIQIEACDTSGTGELLFGLASGQAPALSMQTLTPGATTGSGQTPGCGFFEVAPASPLTIANAGNTYWAFVQWNGAGAFAGAVNLRAIRIFYRLQVSAAPGTAAFGDVPVGSPLHRFVEALVAAGITGGCGGGNYCPDAPLTRGQMAVFLSAALGLHFPN